MRGEELAPGCVLLVGRECADSVFGFALFVHWVVSLVGDGDLGKLVLAVLAGIEGEDLIFFVLVKAEVAVILGGALRVLLSSPDEAALLGAFLAHEEHAGGVTAVRARRFFLVVPATGEIGAIGDRETDSAVGLDNVNAADRDDAEVRI